MNKLITIFAVLVFSANFLLAQKTITGVVYDEKGEPIAGATVIEKNTENGTITDIDGKFILTLQKANSHIKVSFIGFKSVELATEDKTHFIIHLEPETKQIDEVVVMGYTNKMRSEIASAVSILKADDVKDITTSDVGAMLQGKVAGVQVVQNSGEPGANAQVRIRGVSTIKPGNQEPLYVVDGIIGGSFDPNDIESITVLKDAGATGLYGARANKGVVIITTKSAKKGTIHFEVKTDVGFRTANHGNLKMMSGEEFFDYSKELYRDPETHQIDIIRFYQDYPKELKDRNFDWVHTLFRPALVQNYYISVSGGSDKHSQFFSTSYRDENGTFRNTYYKQLNIRLNERYSPSRRFNLNTNLNVNVSNGSYYDYMDMFYTFLMIPWDYGLDSNGNPIYVDASTSVPGGIPDGRWWSRDKINPIHTVDNSQYRSFGVDANYDIVLNYRITEWLTFKSTNRLSYSTSKNHNFVSPIAAGTYHGKGWINQTQQNWFGAITTNLLKFSFSLGKSSFNGLLGYEAEKGYDDNLSAEGKGLPRGFNVLDVASSELRVGGYYELGAMQSFISQFNYDFDKRFFLTASYRIDASSNFPQKHRVAHFPTLSVSWLLSNEPFLASSSVIKLLKLRASWGVTGDPDIGASRYLGLFSLNTQYNSQTAAIPAQLPNPNLTWERTFEKNVGLDLSLSRFNLSVDLYHNLTKDLIVLVAQPLSVGFESRWENRGQVTNMGIEVTSDFDIIKTNNVYWNFNFTFSYNKNVLSGIDKPFYRSMNGISQIYESGGEIYTFVLPKWLGVDPQTGAPLWEKVEYDQDGKVVNRTPTSDYAQATPQKVGNALPRFLGGFGTVFSFKKLTFSASFVYQYGNYVYNFTRMFMDNDGHEPYYNAMVPKPSWSRWKKPGDIATHPSMQNAALSNQVSSRYLEKGAFLKVRNISITYNLPLNLFGGEKKQMLGISFKVDDPKVFTPFWGQDPEVTYNQRDWEMPGVLDFKYPNNIQYILSINLKF